MATLPLSGCTRPWSISRSVDLPEPLGPIRPMRSPSETVNEIFWKSGAVPYRFESPCALIIGGKLFGLLLESVYPRRVCGAKRGEENAAVIREGCRRCAAAAGVNC